MPARQDTHITTFSHDSTYWMTPERILIGVRLVLKKIDLDPASCPEANERVGAGVFLDHGGLECKWWGKVFLNPPWSKIGQRSAQGVWAQKLVWEYEAGRVEEAILLVKSALGYQWYEELYNSWWVCHLRERPKFLKPGGIEVGRAKQGISLFYFGKRWQVFQAVFRREGRVLPPQMWLEGALLLSQYCDGFGKAGLCPGQE